MLYSLTKLSSPSFTLLSECPEVILSALNTYISDKCKQTEAQVTDNSTQYPTVDAFEQALYTAIPNNFHQLPIAELISVLLETPCGSEFNYITYNSHSDYLQTLSETFHT